jgi:hypothetical protein
MTPFDAFDDPGASMWMNACTAAGQFTFGEGNAVTSGPTHCTYRGSQIGTSYAVQTRADCHPMSPGYRHIFDLSGNVAEWENACERDVSTGSQDDACRTRGGSFDDDVESIACAAVPTIPMQRRGSSWKVGFRCCGPYP